MNSLKSFIKANFKANYRLANELGVTPQTVGTWVTKSPRGALRYMSEITDRANCSPQYLLNVVTCTEEELGANKTNQS